MWLYMHTYVSSQWVSHEISTSIMMDRRDDDSYISFCSFRLNGFEPGYQLNMYNVCLALWMPSTTTTLIWTCARNAACKRRIGKIQLLLKWHSTKRRGRLRNQCHSGKIRPQIAISWNRIVSLPSTQKLWRTASLKHILQYVWD